MTGGRAFAAIWALAVVCVLAAVWAVMRAPVLPGPGAEQPALPGLAGRLDDIDGIDIDGSAGTVTLRRTGAVWRVAERDGYPAAIEPIERLLAAAEASRLIEKLTDRPDRLGRLGLADPAADQAVAETPRQAGIRVGFAPVGAAILVGHARIDGLGDGRAAWYGRRPDSDQAYLVAGGLSLSDDPRDWLRPHLLDIDPAEIVEVLIEGPDRRPLRLQRGAGAENFGIVGLPADRRIDRPYRVDNVATALEALELLDVRPADGLDFAADGRSASFTLADGLILRARLAADPDPGARPWNWVIFEGADATDAAGRPAARLRALLAPLEGWAFRLPGYKASRLYQRLEDITEAAP